MHSAASRPGNQPDPAAAATWQPDLKGLPEHKPPRPATTGQAAFVLRNALGLWRKLTTGLGIWRVDSRLLRGSERWSGAPLIVLYRGHGENLEYLKRLFFRPPVETTTLADTPVWRLYRPTPCDPSCDFVCCERPLPWSLVAAPPPFRTYLCWVKQHIEIPATREALLGSLRRKTRMEAERLIRKHGFTASLTPAAPLCRMFYDEFYLPTVRSRFGEEGQIVDFNFFARRCRDARLLLVRQQTRIMGGLLLHAQGATLVDGWTGLRMRGDTPEIAGISDVLDYCSQEIAYREGFDWLDMGTSRAALSDGTLRYKQRWGGRLSTGRIPKGTLSLAVSRGGPAVDSWIDNSGLIGRHGGHLVVCRRGPDGAPTDVDLDEILR